MAIPFRINLPPKAYPFPLGPSPESKDDHEPKKPMGRDGQRTTPRPGSHQRPLHLEFKWPQAGAIVNQ